LAPWRAIDEGILLVVRVTPRGGRDAIDGTEVMSDNREILKLRVRAAPESGAANDAVIELLAKTLKIRRSDIDIVAGVTARVKQIILRGNSDVLTTLLGRASIRLKGKKTYDGANHRRKTYCRRLARSRCA
jgi:uncharacterized protein (TIGR00251 family)